jgi:hypothetical protein
MIRDSLNFIDEMTDTQLKEISLNIFNHLRGVIL